MRILALNYHDSMGVLPNTDIVIAWFCGGVDG